MIRYLQALYATTKVVKQMRIILSKILLISVCYFSSINSFAATQEEIEARLAAQQQANSSAPQQKMDPIFPSRKENEKNNEQATTPNELLNADMYNRSFRKGTLLPGEQRIELLLPPSEEGVPPPFGANLFAGGYETERVDGLNDDYLIAPGDKISIWLWGAVNLSSVVTVDNQGNIFLPNIGPIKVGDTAASGVNTLVTNAIRRIYKNNVNVYVNLLTATPVSVYLSGPVVRPGQYAGMASDSVLYFLKRAGGIDADRGSYRQIDVMRNNEQVIRFDLYDFLIHGQLPSFTFKDGDVILVKPQGATVTVMDGARNPFRFEFKSDVAKGSELAAYARPLSKVSHVGLVGTRPEGPFSLYLPYTKFSDFELMDGDRVLFNDDWDAEIYDIKVTGSHLGPSFFTVQKSTRLHDLLSYVAIDPNLADFENIYILRKSVAQKQKEMIDQALDRLERSVYTAPVQSSGEGTIRAQEAKLVSEFVLRAKQVKPLGKVIVAQDGNIANILLEQGDEIVIPQKSDLVHVGGEVLMPQSIVFNSNASIEDYIAWAGGYSERANHERIVVVHANGIVDFVEDHSAGWLSGAQNASQIKPGDQILVLPKVDAKTMQTVKDITQIIYQIAIAANVVRD